MVHDTRFCIDYRRLNQVTHKDFYPLPQIDRGSDWGTVVFYIYLKGGHWQVQLEDPAKEKTAFSAGNGPATFEQLMEQVLVGLPMSVALVYLVNIFVPGHTFSQQLAHLRQVFDRLRRAKLKLSSLK